MYKLLYWWSNRVSKSTDYMYTVHKVLKTEIVNGVQRNVCRRRVAQKLFHAARYVPERLNLV